VSGNFLSLSMSLARSPHTSSDLIYLDVFNQSKNLLMQKHLLSGLLYPERIKIERILEI